MNAGRSNQRMDFTETAPLRRFFKRLVSQGTERRPVQQARSDPRSQNPNLVPEQIVTETKEDIYRKLKHLKDLFRAGIISKTEYEARKRELLT